MEMPISKETSIKRRIPKRVFAVWLCLSFLLFQFNNCGKSFKSGTDSGENSAASFSGQFDGWLDGIENSGIVFGWAQDTQVPSARLSIQFYVDGPVGLGTYAGQTVANLKIPGTRSGYYFSYQLPAAFADGRTHQIHAYVVRGAPENLLPNGMQNYLAYTPKAEAVFNSSLKTYISSTCNACHSWTFKSLFYGQMISPAPGLGGTALNNAFINKIGGTTHQGNQFCPTKADFPCSEIQRWWRAEFQ